jgi:hypothetical protein
MTARSGMTNLIQTLRGMCDIGATDYTISGSAYWTDNQLQDVMDTHRVDIWREPLSIIETYTGGGSVEYLHYQSEYTNFEETTGGTGIFWIEEADGDKITTGFTPDYQRGHITFAADTSGTVYYLTGRTFDLNASAADIWRRKAAHYGASFSFSTDNHRIDKGALIQNALRMSDVYSRLCGPVSTTLYRSDVDDTAIYG